MYHYIKNVIIKLLYNDSKMTINHLILVNWHKDACKELISIDIYTCIYNIQTFITFLKNILDIWFIFKYYMWINKLLVANLTKIFRLNIFIILNMINIKKL